MVAEGSNRQFHHGVTTLADRKTIWALWTDPASWRQWDLGLRSASGPAGLGLGAVGTIVSKVGQTSAFQVTEWTEGEAYAFDTALPLAKLRVRRSFAPGETTAFTHEVTFSGPLGWLWAAVLGRGFRRDLPPTMTRLVSLAEETRL